MHAPSHVPDNQRHLLQFWNELSAEEQAALARDIASFEFPFVAQLAGRGVCAQDWKSKAEAALPPERSRVKPESAVERGRQALRSGEVGVVLVAGGEGSRLGFDYPKGMFPIGPVSDASLFQILLEKVVATAQRYGRSIPVYLMTSPSTHEKTVAYLDLYEGFGLTKEDLFVFCQGTMPAVDAKSHKILLADKGRVALSPDGTGGLPKAMMNAAEGQDLTPAEHIRSRGIKHLFYFQVDNPLSTVCDPKLLGCHILAESQMTTQVVAKSGPRESLGNVVQIDGKVQILEYSDLNRLDDDVVTRQHEGRSVFWAGNVAVHVIDAKFLRDSADKLGRCGSFHVAVKKVDYLDEHGRGVKPAAENAYKFEQFIFDLLPHAHNAIVVEEDREVVFAPVKNATGARHDTPESARAQMARLHAAWLRKCGVHVDEGAPVEISPRLALDAEQLKERMCGRGLFIGAIGSRR